MEPVGLAVGLVGLFSTCMDVMQRVDSYRTAGRDSRQLDAQLNATMHLFERWGDGVGISKGKLSDNHHPDLDNPRTYAVTKGLLNSIKDFSATSNDPPSPGGLQKTASFPTSGDITSHVPKISKWQKTAWALRGKLKQTTHVQALAGLVSDLYSVVPPDTKASNVLTRSPSLKDLSINTTPQPYAEEIRELLQKIEEEMEADKIRDLHLWLGAPPPNDVFSDSNDKRVEETCEWILHRDEFLEWQKPSSSSKLLWIKGPAGFGKTVLCARIVQELERTAQEPVAYFFLSSRYDGRDDPFSAIRTWVAMMIQRNPVARDIVTKTRLSQHEPRARQDIILRAFREITVHVRGCILVLDGLDECTGMTNTDTKSVPHFLQELRRAITDSTTKILISSRGDPIIQQGISDFTEYSEYTIVPDDVGPDLMAYSSRLVKAKLPNKDEPTRASIAQKMKDRSEGQFQWVKLQEGSLRKGRSRKQLEREIDETPSGLDGLYDREWNRIMSMGGSDKDRALSLLQWTAFALRPLTVFEITEAVLISEELEEFPFEEMPDCVDQDYVESMILELCGSLIEVRYVSPSETINYHERIQDSEEDSIGLQGIHLSHFSVKDYLLLKTFPGTNTLLSNEKLRVTNEKFHNVTLAKHCLRFMSFRGVWEVLRTNKNERSAKHFMFYAVLNGLRHCQYVRNIDPELQQAIMSLLDSRNENWLFVKEFMETKILGDGFDFQEYSLSPFLFAIMSELTDAVTILIREGSLDMNDRSFGNSTPLYWACHIKNKGIVELLIENGADINARCHKGETPLHVSVSIGSNEVTKFLISRGADTSAVDDERQTPLNVASRIGNVEVARQLIDGGADISHETTDGITPLSMASGRGHVEFAKLLIKRGAHVNQGHLPLSLAVWYNQSELAELLIDEGAELTGIQISGQMFSLLAVAAGKGHLNMVKSLIRKGFNPTEAQPLLLAASYGRYGGFSSNLDVKTAATSPDYPRSGYHQVLELLLENGADVNTSDVHGYTPLHTASTGGFIDIVEILIRKSADLSAKTVAGQTPLQSSSASGQSRVTQYLIQHGADVGSKDNCGRNALHHACWSGDLEAVNLMIASSQIQTLDEADYWGSTPLSIAARFGRVGILRALIDTGTVEVESSDKFGRTSTWWAASRNNDAISRLLGGIDRHRDLRTDVQEGEAVQEQGLEMGIYCDICWLPVSGTTDSQPLHSLLHYKTIDRTYHHAIKMKLTSSLLTLITGSVVNAKYTTKIPEDAVWVTNWDELHAAPQFGGVLLPKYGGFVIEVDEKIVLATDERMSKEVLDLLTDLEKNDPRPEDEQSTPNKRDVEIRGYGNRCSHPPCFGPGLCSQYSHCHLNTMSQPNTEVHESINTEATCCSNGDGIAYKDLSPEQKEISDILRNMDRDPDLLGLADLGKDGVFRFLDADRNIHYAVPLRPTLIKALIDRLPYDPEVEKFWRGVDGTQVPEEQWYNPPEGILPPPLTEEEKREEREIMEKNKDKIDKVREDLKNGIHRERLVFIESDNKLG
ncbi:ankyrin repeat domain-containing protein [Fusarium mexicanum]|uniref:Ankyrin repeat domain-containing protein n=1 Tax=Fusarium mexicanum TaxID=751941 RepID=A0A8H5ISQ6_9HYPO|nr:ankyrin repeat domain-containing protein [Fusarium mexicanum]